MVIFSWIVGVLLVNYIIYSTYSYFALRYFFKDNEMDSLDGVPAWAYLLFGSLIVIISLCLLGARKLDDIKLPHLKVQDLAKKHRQQDHDVSYQLEKHLLDKK